MNCSKCGAEISRDDRYCPVCGAENENFAEDNEPIENKTTETEAIETETIETETPNTDTPTPNTKITEDRKAESDEELSLEEKETESEPDLSPIPNAEEDSKPERKLNKWQIIAIAIAALIIVSSIVVTAMPKRDLAEFLAGKDYGKKVMEQVILYSGDYAVESSSAWSNLNSVSFDAGLNISFPEAYEADLAMLASFFLPISSDAVVSMLANSALKLSLDADFNSGLMGVGAEYLVRDENILNASAVSKDSDIYLTMPQLLTGPVILGEEITGLSDVSTGLKDAAATFQGMGLEPLRPAIESIAAAFPEHFDFSIRKHVDVPIGDENVNVDAVVFDITQRNMDEALIEAIDIILADTAAVGALTDFYNYYYTVGSTPGTADDTRIRLQTQKDSLTSALTSATDISVGECSIYMNEENELAGFGFIGHENYDGLTLSFGWDVGRGYEFKLAEPEIVTRVYGALSDGDKKSGDMYISSEGGYAAYSGKLLDFSDFDENGGTFVMTAADIMDTFGVTYDMLSYDFGPFAAYTEGLFMTATFSQTDIDSHVSAVLQNSAGAELSLSFDMLKNGVNLSVPTDATAVANYDEILGKVNIGGISEVLTKLSGMGFDLSDLINIDMLMGV